MDQQPELETSPIAAPSSEDKNLALLSHILIIFTFFIGPLVIWLVKKDSSPYVAEQAKEGLNFCITMFIAYVVSGILVVVLIGILMLWVLGLLNLILPIIAAVKTGEGQSYRYPFTLRLL